MSYRLWDNIRSFTGWRLKILPIPIIEQRPIGKIIPSLLEFWLTCCSRYTDHTYMVLTLQKLVHVHNSDGNESDMDETDSIGGTARPRRGRLSKAFHKMFSRSARKNEYDDKQRRASTATGITPPNGFVMAHTDGITDAPIQKLRTLQRYHGGVNQERMNYMEHHSPLTRRGLTVSAEQVSIFLTAGKTRVFRLMFQLLIGQTTRSSHFSSHRLMISSSLSSIVWLLLTQF
jgi:hypothetical protein